MTYHIANDFRNGREPTTMLHSCHSTTRPYSAGGNTVISFLSCLISANGMRVSPGLPDNILQTQIKGTHQLSRQGTNTEVMSLPSAVNALRRQSLDPQISTLPCGSKHMPCCLLIAGPVCCVSNSRSNLPFGSKTCQDINQTNDQNHNSQTTTW